MKRRFLALALALVMVVGILPASILTANAITIDVDDVPYDIQETPIDLSVLTNTNNSAVINNTGTPVTFTQTAIDSANDEASTHYLTSSKNAFNQDSDTELLIIQDIQINSMPVFTSFAHGHVRIATGYFVTLPKNLDGNADNGSEIFKICIYRKDNTNNLYVAVGNVNNTIGELYPLGVTLGERFKLTAHCKSDASMDIYCNDTLVHSFTNADTFSNTSGNNTVFRVGYNSYGADDSIAGANTDIKVYSIAKGTKVAHVHKGGTATCSSKAVCTGCGQEYGEADGNHVPGKDGVCTLCQTGGFFDFTSFELEETAINLGGLTNSNNSTVITAGATTTIIQSTLDTAYAEANCHYLTSSKNAFNQDTATELYITQDIQIDSMPAFTTFTHGHVRVATGYFVTLPKNLDGNADNGSEIFKICIYRIDATNNLYVAVGTESNTISELYPLGVTLGERFKLMAHCKSDVSVDIYCNGEYVNTFAKPDTFSNTSGNNTVFRVGYNSYGADDSIAGTNTDIKIYSINTATKVAHEHVGGQATCTNKAVCTACGEEYGEFGLHTPGRDGKCTECGLGGFMDYVNYNVIETPINISEFDTKVGSALEIGNDGFTATISQDAFDTTGKEANTHYVSQKAFASPGEKIYSQDIEIVKMPIFSTRTVYQSRSANGYYMVVGNDADAETPYELTIISIYRIDEAGNLVLGIADIANYTFRSTLYPLGKTLGQRFKLTTVFKEDGKLDVYCDGVLICSTTESVEHTNGTDTICNALRIGYSSYQATAPESGDTSTLINIYSLNEVTMEAHVHAPVEDDFNCTTGYTCACGTEIAGEADHANPGDDGNCATDVVCSNPGCNVVLVEGHELQHVGRVEPDGATPGMKEHWYCATDEAYFLDEAGTQKVNSEDLVISAVVDVEDGKATVKDEFADVVTGSEGQVELEVPTASGVELPAAVLDALQTKGQPLVITTSEGKVTLNQDFLAVIKNTTGDSGSLSVEVKAGATLEAAQETELAKKGTVKEVISAEMLAGGAPLHDFTGTVTIEIPFELAPNTTANDYQLWYVDDNGTSSEQIVATFADGKMTATLEHFSNYAIVTTATQPVQGNGTITSNGGSATATVTGTYYDGLSAGDAFSVDVEWDGLSFSYMAANTWDPETHTHTGGGWEEATGSVTVVNHSNIDVTVTVTKVDEGGEKNLGIVFQGDGNAELDTLTDNLDAGTTANIGELADKFVVEFKPRGTLDETDKDVQVTLATITVTITKYDPQN